MPQFDQSHQVDDVPRSEMSISNGRTFANEAMARGVAVSPGEAFRADPDGAQPRAVQVRLCAEESRRRIENGLEIIAALLRSHPEASVPIVEQFPVR